MKSKSQIGLTIDFSMRFEFIKSCSWRNNNVFISITCPAWKRLSWYSWYQGYSNPMGDLLLPLKHNLIPLQYNSRKLEIAANFIITNLHQMVIYGDIYYTMALLFTVSWIVFFLWLIKNLLKYFLNDLYHFIHLMTKKLNC